MRVSRVAVVGVFLFACTSSEPSEVTPVGGTLVSVVDEPAGEHCANGGSAIQTGVDDNHDGVLDAAEVDKTDYVCKGALDTPTLVRKTAIAAGDVCPGGGVLVQTGRDLDHDGVLSDAEVEQTVTACDTVEVWNGDLATSQWTTPAQLEVLASVRVINGNLSVDSEADLPKLELVTGDVTTSGDDVELPKLSTIVGGLRQQSYATTRLALPVLERVGGQLVLHSTAHDAIISAPALTSVGDGVSFIFLVGKDTIDLSGLQDVGGDLFLDSDLPNLSLTKLTTITGALKLEMDATNAVMPALKTIGGELHVESSHLTQLTLPALDSIAGDLYVLYDTPITAIRLANLKTIGGGVSMSPKTLATLDLTSLTDVARDIIIDDTALTALRLPSLRHIGALNPIAGSDFYNFRSLQLAQNKALATIDLSSLVTMDGWIIVSETDALTNLDLPALTKAYEVAVQYCPAFTAVRAKELPEVTKLTLWELPKLSVAEFPKLARVSTEVALYKTALETLTGLSALTSTGYLSIEDEEELVDLHGLEKLTLVGHARIISNDKLESLAGLEHLTRATGIFELHYNTKLVDVSALASLRYVGMDLLIDANSSLTSLAGLHHVATVQGRMSITWNTALTSLAGLAGLELVGGDLDISTNESLPPGEVTAFRARLGK